MSRSEAVKPGAVASILFALIRGDEPTLAERNLAATYFAETGAPVDYQSFQRFTDALVQSLPQQTELQGLVPRWERVFKRSRLTAAKAEAFIREYLAAMDHSLFVKLPLFVGRFAGVGRHALGFGDFGNSRVDSWMLVYTLAGRGQLRAGLRDYNLTPGNAVLIEPDTLTDFSGSDKFSWHFYWIVFQCADNWRSYLRWPEAGPGVRRLEIASSAATVLEVSLGQLYDNFIDSGPLKLELDHNLLEQLLLRFATAVPGENSRALDSRIQRARNFIEKHFAADIVLADVAAASNISSSRLSALFKRETGSSVMAYRNELRLVKAAQLLLHTNLRIAEVGASVGYPDQAFFARIFRRYLGMSPRQYRANRA